MNHHFSDILENMNCPVCNSELVKVVYGYPTPTMIQRAKSEEIALGGLTNQGYHQYCYGCNDTVPPTIWPTNPQ